MTTTSRARVYHPLSLEEAVALRAQYPEAQVLAGGTDFMVEVNAGHRAVQDVLSLRRVEELRGFGLMPDTAVLGAGLTYSEMEHKLVGPLPAFAQAARTVGSPQIRNAGTLGGNLGTASPAGDLLPVLAALDARVVLASANEERVLGLDAFLLGPKRNALREDELIKEVRVARVPGRQEFLKVGTRNAMVIALANCALVLDLANRRVRCALGSVGPTPIRASEAEAFISSEIDWGLLSVRPSAIQRFGQLVSAAARPITDHRGTAEYRRHAVEIIARRALERVMTRAG